MKYRKYNVRLFIPAADTLIPLTKISKRKYAFKQPLPDTYVVLYNEKGNLNDKRGYDAAVDLADIKTKYSKRKKVYKAKIKRKQIRKTIEKSK